MSTKGYHFCIVNVFAKSKFEGNPLCVFENAEGLDDETMLKLAQQFNLSETVFIFPNRLSTEHSNFDAQLRIFTPSYELPFAGHPVIGAASVINQLIGKTVLRLQSNAGIVSVNFQENTSSWQLQAPCETVEYLPLSQQQIFDLQALLGRVNFAGEPAFVNTGSEQLIIPLSSKQEVDSVNINLQYVDNWPIGASGRKTAYLFSIEQNADGTYQVYSRFFFLAHTGAVGEDPGTGSACANLSGWLSENAYTLPICAVITQGVKMGRECELFLAVQSIANKSQFKVVNQGRFDCEKQKNIAIFVSGKTIELGKGVITL